jgi:hypothetical protein
MKKRKNEYQIDIRVKYLAHNIHFMPESLKRLLIEILRIIFNKNRDKRKNLLMQDLHSYVFLSAFAFIHSSKTSYQRLKTK